MSSHITVAVIDADQAYSSSLKAVLDKGSGIQQVFVHASVERALAEFPDAAPGVLLADISLANPSPAEFVRRLKARFPDATLVILSHQEDDASVLAALLAGACGCFPKQSPLAKVCETVEEAYAGGCPITPQIARKLMQWFHARGRNDLPAAHLTAREQGILSLVAAGAQNQEIAITLHLSDATVRAHLRRTYAKLHVHSRAQAVARLNHAYPYG